MKVRLRIAVETKFFAVDKAARTTYLITALQTVFLEEMEDIVAVNLNDTYVHGVQIDRLERESEVGCVRKDIALVWETNRRLEFVAAKFRRPVIFEAITPIIFQEPGNCERNVRWSIAFFVEHTDNVSLRSRETASVARKSEHSRYV